MKRTTIGIYGIVPIALVKDPEVTMRMLKVYIALSSFQGSNKNCWPSREEIRSRCGLPVRHISSSLTALHRMGWIERRSRSRTNQSNVYWVLFDVPPAQNGDGVEQPPDQKSPEPPDQNDHIHLYEKNIEKNNAEIEAIIDFLNLKTGKKFRKQTKATQRHINARLSEGFTLEDFKKVIAFKTGEWLDNPKMREFLRPETLFGPKFEGYLNAAPAKQEAPASSKPSIDLPKEWSE